MTARSLVFVLLVLCLWPPAVCLAAEPALDELVEAAVQALKKTSYEARMHFIAHYAEGEEQTVHIYHVKPQLYHVRPIEQDRHGKWIEQNEYYIENAVELVRVHLLGGNVVGVEELPQRSFSVNDALTTKFLRDLSRHPGTSVLDGQSGDIAVYILRQMTSQAKPYTITVGLDRRNFFPVFLLVSDATGRKRVYYQMESIEYLEAGEIDPALFAVPQVGTERTMPAPRAQQLPPQAVFEFEETAQRGEGKISIQRQPSGISADAAAEIAEYALPLYPGWLPPEFQLEGIRLLDYASKQDGTQEPALVYQFEAFGPMPGELLSIFQTQAADLRLSDELLAVTPDAGYLVQRQDGWLVVVFGDRPSRELSLIVAGLQHDDDAVTRLINLTRARDTILQEILAEAE